MSLVFRRTRTGIRLVAIILIPPLPYIVICSIICMYNLIFNLQRSILECLVIGYLLMYQNVCNFAYDIEYPFI
jgi:hypothetical protein